MNFIYDIAGVRILCSTPFEITTQKDSEGFIFPDDSKPCDLHFDFRAVGEIKAPESFSRAVNTLLDGNRSYFCLLPDSPPYACVTSDYAERRLVCEYIPAFERELTYSHTIVDLLQLEALLCAFDGILLHSSFIRAGGRGILFTAPSGTGKSTQAELWQKHKGAEILNGDRAAVRKQNAAWQAYGLPYAGSSCIFRNESAPLAAIVVLRQAKENKIRQLNPSEAWRLLYSESNTRVWDRSFTEKALSLLDELTAEIPVYMLECLPDESAVDTLYDAVFKEAKL